MLTSRLPLALALTASLAVSAAYSQTFYSLDGFGEFHGGGPAGNRLIRFELSDPLNPTVIGHTGVASTLMTGMDFSGGVLYSFGTDESTLTGGDLYEIDMGTGAAALIGGGGLNGGDTINDLSWSEVDQKMYGVGQVRGGTVTVYELDLNTGMATVAMSLTDPTGSMVNVGLASHPTTGATYVFDLVTDTIFEAVGGALVPLPNNAGFDANFNQGMSFDPGTGQLYLATWNTAPFRAELRSGDHTSGVTSFLDFIGPINGGSGFGEYSLGDLAILPGAPCSSTVYCDGPNQNGDIGIDHCVLDGTGNTLEVTNSVGTLFAYFVVGNAQGVVTDPPGSMGDLCLGGSTPGVGRYVLDLQSPGGSGAYTTDLFNGSTGGGAGALPNPPGGMLTPGSTWNFQGWQRMAAPTPSTWSKALSVTFQ